MKTSAIWTLVAVILVICLAQVECKKKKNKGPLILTAKNFKKHTASGYLFIKFWSPQCGFCTEMAPQWDELGNLYHGNEDVKIAKIDCSVHKSTCESENVWGFPGLWLYHNGRQKKDHYGDRTVKAWQEFLKKEVPASSKDEL